MCFLLKKPEAFTCLLTAFCRFYLMIRSRLFLRLNPKTYCSLNEYHWVRFSKRFSQFDRKKKLEKVLPARVRLVHP